MEAMVRRVRQWQPSTTASRKRLRRLIHALRPSTSGHDARIRTTRRGPVHASRSVELGAQQEDLVEGATSRSNGRSSFRARCWHREWKRRRLNIWSPSGTVNVRLAAGGTPHRVIRRISVDRLFDGAVSHSPLFDRREIFDTLAIEHGFRRPLCKVDKSIAVKQTSP